MKKTILYIVLAMLCLIFEVKAQSQTNDIRPLKIGDTIPEAVWNTPLQVVNHPEGKKSITLNDYKGKLIIINFWSTSCGTCIKALPKVDALQKEYNGRLQILSVSYEKEGQVRKFLLSNFSGKKFKGITLTNDTLLKKLFSHQLLPHIVVVGNGVYKQSWQEEYLSSDNIKAMLSHSDLNLTQKVDLLNFDYSNPLFEWHVRPGINHDQPLYASVFSGFIDGLPNRAGFNTDSIKRISRYYIINHTALHMYALGLRSELPLIPNRRILEVKTPQTFIYKKENGYLTEWRKNNCYTYERSYPFGTEEITIASQLKNDLDLNLNAYGRIEERVVTCLELHSKQSHSLNSIYSNKGILKDAFNRYQYLHHIQMDDLVYILNELPDALPIIDETRINHPFDLDFKKELNSLQDWQDALQPYGLELKKNQRRLTMFVLSDERTIPVKR